MRKMLVTVAIAAVAAFGLSSCSSAAAPKEEAAVESVAPAEETTGDSSLAADVEVCVELQSLLADASASMQANEVNSITELADTFGTLAEKASSPEIKSAALAVQADLVAMKTASDKVAAGDVAAVQETLDAQANFQKSYTALVGSCAP